jgi:hypothetical protein
MSSSIAKGRHPPPGGWNADGSASAGPVKKTCGLTILSGIIFINNNGLQWFCAPRWELLALAADRSTVKVAKNRDERKRPRKLDAAEAIHVLTDKLQMHFSPSASSSKAARGETFV